MARSHCAIPSRACRLPMQVGSRPLGVRHEVRFRATSLQVLCIPTQIGASPSVAALEILTGSRRDDLVGSSNTLGAHACANEPIEELGGFAEHATSKSVLAVS